MMKIFSKIFVIAIVALNAAVAVSFAQNYTISPNDTVKLVGMMEDVETLSIRQVNISQTTLTLKWKKISESVPEKWEASVCDNSFCNTSLVDSGTMNPVFPTEYGLLLLHITPHVNYGTAIVRYAVWDAAIPSKIDTLTYILSAIEPSGIYENRNSNTVSLFPNPANSNISIKTEYDRGFTFSITNILGEVIETGISKENYLQVLVGNYPNGEYNLCVHNGKNFLLTTKIIVQH